MRIEGYGCITALVERLTWVVVRGVRVGVLLSSFGWSLGCWRWISLVKLIEVSLGFFILEI